MSNVPTSPAGAQLASPAASRLDRAACLLVALLTLFRFWYAGQHELLQDEAYYWQWSRHLAWGYYDNTPLLAYVIRAFTTLFGSTEIGVRAGAVVSALVASLFIYLLAKRTLGPGVALASVAFANVIPLFTAGAVITTQDPLLVAFWAATLWAVHRAVTERAGWWYLAGVLAGLIALAKLNGLFLLPSILVYLAVSPTQRPWLRRPEPYLAALIALAIFSPFVVWDVTHGNAFGLHFGLKSSRADAHDAPLKYVFDYLGAQAALLSPFAFLTYLYTLYAPKGRFAQDDARTFLWAPSATVFALTCLAALRSKVEGNWGVCAYGTGIILMADVLVRLRATRGGRVWVWLNAGVAALLSFLILFPSPLYHLGLKLSPVADRTNELYGWRTMAAAVERERAAMGTDPFVFAINYKLPSEAAFYLPGQPQTHSLFLKDRANQYLFWTDPAKLVGRDAVFIDGTDEDPADDPLMRWKMIHAVFQSVDPPIFLDIRRDPPYKQPIRTIIIARCHGFKGYDRQQWQQGW